ncbi:MAG: PIN domain-containing protein [Nanoarchaeota archaeon]
MYCLDTYALIEIAEGNPKFSFLIKEEVIVQNTTLAEFYWVLIRDKGKEDADFWSERLLHFSVDIPVEIMLKAQKFRHTNKKQDISFFDSVGYIFAQENNHIFVTGDKEFKNFKGVKYITK